MALSEAAREAVAAFLAAALGAKRAEVVSAAPLTGGAIQENWALDVAFAGGRLDGTQRLVLRTDAPSAVAASHGRLHEYAILRVAWDAGVMVPEPLAACADAAVLGKPFYVMRRLEGVAGGHILTRDDRWRGDRAALAFALGRELGTLHRVVPPVAGLEFLAVPDDPARAAVAGYRAWLDTHRVPRPALEWGLAWLDRNAPAPVPPVLCHRDFRTGNYLADANGLTAILDWEFAGWGDPMEDLGWFCARCWRFGAAREAGGIGERADFYRGYASTSPRTVDPGRVGYWETMAHARWAVIALQQGERHVSGAEPSLALALTGRRIAELEYDLLRMTAP